MRCSDRCGTCEDNIKEPSVGWTKLRAAAVGSESRSRAILLITLSQCARLRAGKRAAEFPVRTRGAGAFARPTNLGLA